jgi:glycosyltransferase involved in cell wall biosynthesis
MATIERQGQMEQPGIGCVGIIKSRGVPRGLRPVELDGGTLNLITTVPALVASGVDVSIYTSDPGVTEAEVERLPHVDVHRLPGAPSAGLTGTALDVARLRAFEARLLEYAPYVERTFDVLHTHHWTSAPPRVMAQKRCGRHVHTPHLLVSEKARMLGLAPLPEAHTIERVGLQSADLIIAVSQAEARSIIDSYGIAGAKIEVVPNGVGSSFVRGALSPEVVARRVTESPLQIASVGRLVQQKGFDVLIDAMASARELGLETACTIIGAGYHSEPEYPAFLQARAAALGLEKSVTFAGALDAEGVAERLKAAAIYVQPTRYESQGVAILEAMTIGLPVVTTDVPAVTEHVDGGRNGLVVAVDDAPAVARALLRLSNDPTLAATMSRANRAGAERHDWSFSHRRLMNCFGFAKWASE